MMMFFKRKKCAAAAILGMMLMAFAPAAWAEIDGHGPDSWRVNGVASNDTLNVRMGPGTNYPVIETFAHNERNLNQITCVPYYTAAHYTAMTQAQIKALPQRWCLMRNASMTKAGWVAQRFITPDNATAAQPAVRHKPNNPQAQVSQPTPSDPSPYSGGDMVVQAEHLVRDLYDAAARANRGQGPDPLQGNNSRRYFTAELSQMIGSGQMQAHPLYGAQDFDGRVTAIAADPETPMFRGSIFINVDFTNFGQPQRAIFYLRADGSLPGSPVRIISVEHDGWSYP